MADSWWDKVVDFAYEHGPKWLQNRIEVRDLAIDASKQYDLYVKREAAGYYAEPIVHPDIRKEAEEARHIYAQQEREERFRADNGFRSREDGIPLDIPNPPHAVREIQPPTRGLSR